MADSESVYEKFAVASWQVGNEGVIRFPAIEITDTKGNRIVQHERPYREGAKLDDTGAKVRVFAMRAYFDNSIREPGIEGNPSPLFPEMLRRMQASFDVHETGNLTVPTVGVVRCKAVSCVRRDTPSTPGGPFVDLVFEQDNEDALDRAIIDAPTVKGSIPALAEQTVFSAQSGGSWIDTLDQLENDVGALENSLNAPGRATNEVESLARRNRRSQARMVATINKFSQAEERPFSEPSGSQTERQLLTLRDRQAQAAGERARSLPQTKEYKIVALQTSLFEIAAKFDQDVSDLLDLNDSLIETPFKLRRGQVIRVFATAPA